MRFKRPGETLERSSKRARTNATMVVYRGPKPEMKHSFKNINHAGVFASDLVINSLTAGTAVSDRVGAKVKIWNIEACLRTDFAYTGSMRIDLVIPFDPSVLPVNTYEGPVLRTEFTLLKTIYLHPGTEKNTKGYTFNHKLPMGVVTKFNGPLGTNVSSNPIIAHIQTSGVTTVTGYFRVWYTDA